MKQILIILGLFASVTTFAQSPRIKLNQITKDTVKGSVLISSPSDSGMVYSRDFYVAYGADTVLILYGDTLAATSGIISSVLSDGVTITGNGTSGNELKVDTATVISTIQGLVDTLTARNYLSVTQLTDTLDANTRGYLTAEVDGSVSNELQTISTSGAAGNITLSDGGGTLNLNVDDADASVSNEGSLTVGAGTASTSVISSNTSGSTDVTLEAGTNVTLTENTGTNTITIASSGGGTSYNNISETADTVFITGDLNVDANTLYVDATNNRVGIGTSTPQTKLNIVDGGKLLIGPSLTNFAIAKFHIKGEGSQLAAFEFYSSTAVHSGSFGFYRLNGTIASPLIVNDNDRIGGMFGSAYNGSTRVSPAAMYMYVDGVSGTDVGGRFQFETGTNSTRSTRLTIEADGDVVIADLAGSGTGGVSVTANGTLYRTSSINIKESVEQSSYGINEIKNLNPVTFYYKDKVKFGNSKDIGFIAEQVYDVIPEAVGITNEGNYHFDNSKLTAVTVKAIQEQQAQIETQQNEIDQLKTLITDLTNRLTILENK